jgi:hypothetical protein
VGAAAACAPFSRPPETATPVADLGNTYDEVRLGGLEARRFGHGEYWSIVDPVVERGSTFRREVVGRSAEGRSLVLVSYGEGPTPVLLWSQMHGDESTATMALADIFAFLADRPEHPTVRRIRRSLTVHVVPLLNPDGAERFQRRNAQGVDINRDARVLSTPEARTLKAVRDRVEPAFAFNLHDQGIGTRVGDSDRGVAIALLAPPFNEAREVNAAREAAMKVAGVIRRSIEPMVGDHIARYDDTFNPRAFGDLMTQWGAGTILIESGGWSNDPQKQYLRKVNFVGILAALESIALRSYESAAVDTYASLPRNGRRVGDLLLLGGSLAVPGLPELKADLLINYENPLLQTGGEIAEIGDLVETEARDTVVIEGLFVVPSEAALDREKGVQIQPGSPAEFVIARRRDGSEPVWSFQGRPPPDFHRGEQPGAGS